MILIPSSGLYGKGDKGVQLQGQIYDAIKNIP